jgi:hypothetical protein
MRRAKYVVAFVLGIAGLLAAASLVYSTLPFTGDRSAAPPQSTAARPASAPVNPVETDRPDPAPAVVTAAPERPEVLSSRPARRPGTQPIAAAPPPAATDTLRPDTVRADSTPGSAPVAPPAPEPSIPVWQATPRQLVRDSAFVWTNAGRLGDAIALLDNWIRGNPSDTAVALDLARLRARTRDWAGSIAQYSVLIERHRTPELLFERGQTYLWSGDMQRGEADLLASEALAQRVETRRQLGDFYRWQGDLARSALWYRRALATSPGDSAVLNALGLLDDAIGARLLMPGELGPGDFGSGVHAISDNAGFDFYSLRIGQSFGVAARGSTSLALTAERRSVSRLGASGASDLGGFGLDASIARRLGSSRVTATLGVLDHDELPSMMRGGLTADGFLGNARMRASIRHAPAYEHLWAPRLQDHTLAGTDGPVTVTQGQLTVSLPLAREAEVWAMGEYLDVSDENARSALQMAVRRRVNGLLSVLYSGSVMAYRSQTALYYSPGRYLSQAVGVELSAYREAGLSFALRLTPGYAWMRETAGTLDGETRDVSAFQLGGGLDLGFRRGGWDLLLSAGLTNGREGGYRSRSALLTVRRSR